MPKVRTTNPRPAIGKRLFLILVCTLPAGVAGQDWIELSSPRMKVLSQVSEDRTREWAKDFDQFIDALSALVPANEALLPPLTAILFRRNRDFNRYQIQTETGRADIQGVFANYDTWSVMSLTAGRSLYSIDRITYHEAVHWYMSADPFSYPPWYMEGIAEVLSTYRVVRGNVRWGATIPEAVAYLRYAGLQPMREFLIATQNTGLHGEERFYPQAWAFVHYMMFGQRDGSQQQLQALVRGMRESNLDLAFADALGRSFDEVGRELSQYINGGRYGTADVPLTDISASEFEYTVRPAQRENVTLSLARLAYGTGNVELADDHLKELEAIADDAATTHDLRAAWGVHAGDDAVAAAAVDRAIALGSVDAQTHQTKANLLIRQNLPSEGVLPDRWFSPDVARQIVDAAARSIGLRPFRLEPYLLLVNALISAETITDNDRRVLESGERFFPGEGVFDVGLALLSYRGGSTDEAITRLSDALSDAHRSFTPEVQDLGEYLYANWKYEDVVEYVEAAVADERFRSALIYLDNELRTNQISQQLGTSLLLLRQRVEGRRRMLEVETAFADDRIADGRRMLEVIVSDPDIDQATRSDAQLLLEQLN